MSVANADTGAHWRLLPPKDRAAGRHRSLCKCPHHHPIIIFVIIVQVSIIIN